MTKLLKLILISLSLATASRAAEAINVDLARTIPIADIHMHLYGGKNADFYQKRMKDNNVQWAGAVGGGPKDSPLNIKAALGPKYIAALGQTEFFGVL